MGFAVSKAPCLRCCYCSIYYKLAQVFLSYLLHYYSLHSPNFPLLFYSRSQKPFKQRN
ncbi:hypothetical protein NTHI1209_01227 [Haemophilus influenzae]|uniref:Uncharacterized protein n=1 Tax=Haemophilus influenzae TaxID=727 RepID=A0A158SXM6_HAEIF|nr:hypothetical protein NTHI1209_01227 [Haemophilus influenzae]